MPQGTVKTYDPVTRTAVILDDGLKEIQIPSSAFAASGLRELRIGQRVRFEFEGTSPTNLNIVSL